MIEKTKRKRIASFIIIAIVVFLVLGPYWPITRTFYIELRTIQGISSIPILIDALSDRNELSSRVAIGKLVNFGHYSVKELSALLSNQRQPTIQRARAAECLGLIGVQTKDSISALRLGISDEDGYVQVQSLRALWRINKQNDEIVDGLTKLLSSPEYKVVYEAIQSLGEIGPPAYSAIDNLIVVRDTNHLFKKNAIDAIHSIQCSQ